MAGIDAPSKIAPASGYGEIEIKTRLRKATVKLTKALLEEVGVRRLEELGWSQGRLRRFLCANLERVRLAKPPEIIAMAYMLGLPAKSAYAIAIGGDDAEGVEFKSGALLRMGRVLASNQWSTRPNRSKLLSGLCEQVEKSGDGKNRRAKGLIEACLGLDSARLRALAFGRVSPSPWVDARIAYYTGKPIHEHWGIHEILMDKSYLKDLQVVHEESIKFKIPSEGIQSAVVETISESEDQESKDEYDIRLFDESLSPAVAIGFYGTKSNLILRTNTPVMKKYRLHIHEPRLPDRPMYEASLALLTDDFLEVSEAPGAQRGRGKLRAWRARGTTAISVLDELSKICGMNVHELRAIGTRGPVDARLAKLAQLNQNMEDKKKAVNQSHQAEEEQNQAVVLVTPAAEEEGQVVAQVVPVAEETGNVVKLETKKGIWLQPSIFDDWDREFSNEVSRQSCLEAYQESISHRARLPSGRTTRLRVRSPGMTGWTQPSMFDDWSENEFIEAV